MGVQRGACGARRAALTAFLGRSAAFLRVANSGVPQVVQSWMYHANVLAEFAHWWPSRSQRPRLYTSVRGAAHAAREQGLALRLVRRLDAFGSRAATAVVFNSARAARQHAALGYPEAKFKIIPNGFETDRFRPDAEVRRHWRERLGAHSQPVVGIVARRNVLKGHDYFLDAAREVLRSHPDALFVCAGKGCGDADQGILREVRDRGLDGRVRLLGEIADVAGLYCALDVIVCASISESFPNVIGEAMACGVPPVVTDVGDCADLVGDAGLVVAARDAPALAGAIGRLLSENPAASQARGAASRKRIIEHYSIQSVVGKFESLYAG